METIKISVLAEINDCEIRGGHLNLVVSQFGKPKQQSNGSYQVICSCYEDKTASFSIADKDGTDLLHSHAEQLLYQVIRYDNKSFSQQRPDGKGDWIRNLQGIKPAGTGTENIRMRRSHSG